MARSTGSFASDTRASAACAHVACSAIALLKILLVHLKLLLAFSHLLDDLSVGL
jgi:hypothetical protein